MARKSKKGRKSQKGRKMEMGLNLKPFISKVVAGVQDSFTARPIAGCVANQVAPGMSGQEIKKLVSRCAHPHKKRKKSRKSPKAKESQS